MTGAAGAAVVGVAKTYFEGTHRACPPEETLDRIRPVLPRLGITRLASLAGLDDIGIPVYQAVRPNARLLSVAQGKGLTPAAAKVSAAMESIEMWHAERPEKAQLTATVAEVTDALPYRLTDLLLAPRHCLNPHLRLDWLAARRLGSDEPTWLPAASLNLDATVGGQWAPPVFVVSTNGLASGNTTEEAIVHGLYELVERDALKRSRNDPALATPVDPATVTGPAGALVELFRVAGVRVTIEHLDSPVGVPCFTARIGSDNHPVEFEGYGSHLDVTVALCRALTEAAQSRVTAIAGTRDDIEEDVYEHQERTLGGDAGRPDAGRDLDPAGRDPVAFATIPTRLLPDLAEEAAVLIEMITAYTGTGPMVLDHTRSDIGIPVVHVVCPGLRISPERDRDGGAGR
jgi:ribosomal protein S12 methylthiotransferase accessory factor